MGGANINDPVPNLPPADPAGWLNNYSGHFGNDPTSPQFGGNDFAASSAPGTPSGFDPLYYATLKAHSSYWDPNSASLLNMAHRGRPVPRGHLGPPAAASSARDTPDTAPAPRCRIARTAAETATAAVTIAGKPRMNMRWATGPATPPSRRNPRATIAGMSAALALFLAVALSACTGSSVNHQPTMTQQQATAHADQIIQDTVAALTPRPQLETDQYLTSTSPCLDDTNPQPAAGRIVVARGYWLRGITQASNVTIGEQVLQLWKKGWVISSTQGIGTRAPQITGLAKPYAFRISLQSSDNGALSLGASSVCIWPNGTPPPNS